MSWRDLAGQVDVVPMSALAAAEVLHALSVTCPWDERALSQIMFLGVCSVTVLELEHMHGASFVGRVAGGCGASFPHVVVDAL